jgi:hypothetical protein
MNFVDTRTKNALRIFAVLWPSCAGSRWKLATTTASPRG